MKQLPIFLLILSIIGDIYQYGNKAISDPLMAYSSKYVVDLPEQLNSADTLIETYMVARLQNDTVYVYFAPYNGYQLRVNASADKSNIESYTIFDNDRIVGTFKDSTLDSIVVNDNK